LFNLLDGKFNTQIYKEHSDISLIKKRKTMVRIRLKTALIILLIFTPLFFAMENIIIFKSEEKIVQIDPRAQLIAEKKQEATHIIGSKEFACKLSVNELIDVLIHIDNLCKIYDIDYDYVKAVISCESRWNHLAKSSGNAYGLMQITHIGAKAVEMKGGQEQYDPKYNVETGIALLSQLYDMTQNMNTTLVAYNAGIGTVKKHGQSFVDNNTYLKSINGWLNFFENA
jgi:soluble lytic murein transglycosylase-like protein